MRPISRDSVPAVRGGLGRLDAWINNAGADILTGAAASLSDVAKLDLLLSVDLRGTMLASWRAAEILAAEPDGGVIINMSWDHVLTGMAGTNPQLFAAVKGGVLAFSKSLARSVAPRVRVNAIAPGWIETSFASDLNSERRQSSHRVDAPGAMGYTRRCGWCCSVPRITGCRIHHRADFFSLVVELSCSVPDSQIGTCSARALALLCHFAHPTPGGDMLRKRTLRAARSAVSAKNVV